MIVLKWIFAPFPVYEKKKLYRSAFKKSWRTKPVNSLPALPDDKILALSKMKVFADDTLKSIFFSNDYYYYYRIENIVGKEEMLLSAFRRVKSRQC